MICSSIWPHHGSEMGELVRHIDWSETSLGPIGGWPASLRIAVTSALDSPFPTIVLWGPESIQIYNDAYRTLLGSRHPVAMGQRTQACWPEVWHFNEPIYRRVLDTGECIHFEDQEYVIEASGMRSTHYFTISYAPARDESGAVCGVLVVAIETTQRVCAERENIALLKAAQFAAGQLHQMFDHAPSFMALLEGPGHVFKIANAAYMRLSGGRDIIGKPVQQAIPELARQGFVKLLDDVYRSGKPFLASGMPVYLQNTPDGPAALRYRDFVYQPINDADGNISAIFVDGIDVTEQHHAKLELTRVNRELANRVGHLEQAEKRQSFQLDIADLLRRLSDPDKIFSATSALVGRYFNVCRVVYGQVDAENQELTYHSNYTDGTVRELLGTYPFASFWAESFASLQNGATWICRNLAQDAHTSVSGIVSESLAIRSALAVPLSRAGALIAVLFINHSQAREWADEEVALIEDVCERVWNAVERIRAEQHQRHAEAELRESQERFLLLLESSGEGIYGIGPDNTCTFLNTSGAAMLGYRPGELVGRPIHDVLLRGRADGAPFSKSASRIGRAARDGVPIRANDEEFSHKDGTPVPVSYSVHPMVVVGKTAGAVITYSDITERKHAEEALRQSTNMLQRLLSHQEQIKEEERKRIAREIHDDLGQNLMALRIDISMLHVRTARAHPRLHEWVGVALNNIDTTIKSVRSIINDLRPFELELGLQAAVEWQLKGFERMSGIACQLSIAETAFAYALGNERTLAVFRILQESLSNIARHSLATRAEVTLSRDEHTFSMTVMDNGVGVYPDDTRKENSFGIVGIKERLSALGGELVIESSAGNGTVLSISIPVEKQE